MKQLKTIFKQIIILALMVSFTGCEDEDDLLPAVKASYTYIVNIDTGTVTFINTSVNASKYVWDFGDNTTSTEINPVKTFTDGTYTVKLSATNTAGGSGAFESEVTILIPLIATFPISFDGANTNYGAINIGSAVFTVVDNPDLSGTNTSASKVGSIVNAGAAFEGFYIDLGAPIDLATDKTVKINFWSNTPISVLLKLEEGNAFSEVTFTHGGTGWEFMYFTFNSSDSFSRFTLFVDGPGTTAGTFYIDDITQINTADIPCLLTDLELPIDFECEGIDFVSKDSGDVDFEVIDNPELSGINATASKVGKLVFDANQPWENMNLTLDTPIDFSSNNAVKMKVFASEARTLKLKFETGGAALENDQPHTGSGWEEITFIFTSTDSYSNLILFVDGGSDTTGTFYVDDIEQTSATPPPPPCTDTDLETPIDFDCAGIDYASKDTGDVAFEVVDNPQLSGINATPSKVAKLVFDSNQPWENMNLNLDTPIDFTTDKSVKMKVFASEARTLKLKFETGGAAVENDQPHTGSGWEEITFTLTTSDSFSNLILFVDGGSNTVGTFYVDDIEQVSAVVACTDTDLKTPIDFDCATIDYASKDTGDVAFEVVDNPQLSGINATPSKVAKLVFDSNQPWENMNLNLDTPIDFTTDKSVKMKVFASEARTLKLKFETGGAAVENDQPHTGSGWEEITFTIGSSDSFSNLILFVDGGSNTVGTFYVDDIEQVASGGGGGGLPSGSELVTNGDFETTPVTDNGWLFFPNGGTVELSTAVNNGGANAIKLLASGSPAGAPVLKQEGFAINSAAGGNVVTVTFDIKAAVTQPGAVINVALFSELAAGATRHPVTLPATDNSWQSVSVDITLDPNLDASRGLSIEFQAACGAVAGCNIEMYIDNVSVKVNP